MKGRMLTFNDLTAFYQRFDWGTRESGVLKAAEPVLKVLADLGPCHPKSVVKIGRFKIPYDRGLSLIDDLLADKFTTEAVMAARYLLRRDRFLSHLGNYLECVPVLEPEGALAC